MSAAIDDVQLLERRIAESGLSARRFAMEVLLRDERTIRRWLAGDSPIPKVVVGFLENPIGSPWPGPTASSWIEARSEKWLRAIYRGDIADVRPAIAPDYVGDWLADFSVPDELRAHTLRKLGQALACLDRRDQQGACAAILSIRNDWKCGPLNPPTFEDYVPSRLQERSN